MFPSSVHHQVLCHCSSLDHALSSNLCSFALHVKTALNSPFHDFFLSYDCAFTSFYSFHTLMGGDLAPNLRDQKFFWGSISGKISIFRVKISDDLFFSHQPGSSDFSFLFPHFPYVYYVKCRIYDHFLTRKTQFSLCSCFHAHPTTLLLKILGGPMHGRPPHLNFWGDRPPQSPLGLRP